MHASKEEQELIANLQAAGCSGSCIRTFLRLSQEGQEEEQLKLLEQHRWRLLEEVHRDEACLQELDALLEKERKKRGKGNAYGISNTAAWRRAHQRDRAGDELSWRGR